MQQAVHQSYMPPAITMLESTTKAARCNCWHSRGIMTGVRSMLRQGTCQRMIAWRSFRGKRPRGKRPRGKTPSQDGGAMDPSGLMLKWGHGLSTVYAYGDN
jgi:hypothetical protein